jgi:hypothetical protein
MAYQLQYSANSFVGATDFSSKTSPIFVGLDSTGRAVVAGATTYIEGVLENAPPISNVLSVSYLGVTKVTVDNAYARGTFLMAGTNGYGTDASSGAGISQYCRAVTLTDTTSSGDLATIRLLDANPK